MRPRTLRDVLLAVTALALTAPASAQTDPATMWRRGTTLNVFAGLATDANDRAPLAGAGFGWEVTPRLSIEASGAWLAWGHEAHGFDATLRALVPLRTERTVAPFVAAGVGLHRAWFQVADRNVPDFYRRRIDERPSDFGRTATFTDTAFVLGGGVNVFVRRHLTLRPEADATIAIHDSDTRTTAAVRVQVTYHFEDHPITSARRVAARD